MRRLLALAAFFAIATFGPSPSFGADDRTTCFSLGSEAYKDSSRFEEGHQACTRMINSGRHKGRDLASIYRARGSWDQKQGNLDKALADYGISIRMEPNNVEGYDYRADVYQQQEDYDRALDDYNHATRIDPAYAASYYSRGRIYEKQGKTAAARKEYNSALAVPTRDRIAKWAQDNARTRLKVLDEDEKK